MRDRTKDLRYCYVDESYQTGSGFASIGFTFSPASLDEPVADLLREAGLDPASDEYKSGAFMTRNSAMQIARDAILRYAGQSTSVAVAFASARHVNLGKQALQALQSVVVRNGIDPSQLTVCFDEGMFSSRPEAERLFSLFAPIAKCDFRPEQDSRTVRGIQVSDAIAHSFAQIIKQELTGLEKEVNIGGPAMGYEPTATASLGWMLLMTLRHSLLTRPIAYGAERYNPATDPVVLDPDHDDPVNLAQRPTLLGWGVQVEPEADVALRQAVENALGEIWLGCIH